MRRPPTLPAPRIRVALRPPARRPRPAYLAAWPVVAAYVALAFLLGWCGGMTP